MPLTRSALRLTPTAACILLAATASGEPSATSGLPLFDHHDVLRVRIEGPLSTMTDERSNTDYYTGTLAYADPAAGEVVFDIGFRTRGNFRRKKDTCWFPPVRLNFKKSQTDGTVFEGQDKLKLVTHCHPTRERFQRYVLREYLAYRILEEHTPYAFRARLMEITWVDTDRDDREIVRYGFVIEHEDELADRLEATVFEENATSHDAVDARQAAIVSVFQYLIANTDFSIIQAPPGEACCHNAIVLVGKADGGLYPVPYDFDFAGIVDAPYAAPSPNMSIRDVKQRLYRGNCEVNGEIPAVVDLFLAERDDVLALILGQPGLSERDRERAAAYVDRFYDTISDPRKAEDTFIKGCL